MKSLSVPLPRPWAVFALTLPLFALLLAAAPAHALSSDWAETEGGRMRLAVDPTPRDDGSLAGILEIDLEPGWKTYWRDPGGAGIPPMLDLSQSAGITLEAMFYPPPVRVDDGYAIWAGYTAPVSFPLVLRRDGQGAGEIRAQAFVGICEKICIPFQADFAIALPETVRGSDADAAAIEAAFQSLPTPASADFAISEAVLDPAVRTLSISATLPAFRPAGVGPELFVAAPLGFAFGPPVLAADEAGMARWTIRVEDAPESVASGDIPPIEMVITLGQRAIGESVVPVRKDL